MVDSKDLKRALLLKCQEYVDLRIATAQQAKADAQAAANEESKSSVGDKYETTRSMMHIEGEKAAHQLGEALKLKSSLDRLSDTQSEKIIPGSLVITDVNKIFVSIGIGKVNLGGEEFLVVAPTSPLGNVLIGRSVKERITFNGRSMTIVEVA